MATFEATRSQFTQQHFEVLEIDLPIINGVCTVNGENGFGTPLTCDQAWANAYKTYKFTNQNAPLLSSPNIYRVVTKINENPTQVKPSNGLSSRGTLAITFTDFIADPNEGAQGVTDEVKKQGTFFGKLNARQIMENKAVRLKLYRVQSNGSIDLVNGAETHHYIIESLKSNDNGTWTLKCKDVLSLANLKEKTWPPTKGGFLRSDLSLTSTSIGVDPNVDYSSVFAVRVGDEHFEVLSVTGNQTALAALTVASRGSSIFAPVSGELLTRTEADEHETGDEVFVCDLSDNETIDSLLTRILIASDFNAALIPNAAWADEVAEWHSTDKINTLHSEALDVNETLSKILTGFLMDLWFDQTENLAKLSAISVWKQSAATLTEGGEIDAYTLKDSAVDSLRASRALVLYDKKNLSDNDDVSSYSKAAQNADNQIISEALYKEHKDKVFDGNELIGTGAAQLLVQRYISRFKFTPFNYKWKTQERFLTFKTGDVVDLSSNSIQSPSGLPSGNIRAQVTKITPKYTASGREYDCTAMGYEAAFNNNSEIVIDTVSSSINLYILAGAPSEAVTLTFVMDGFYCSGQTAITAGNFPAGSKLIIILHGGFDGQANGGQGGKGEDSFYDTFSNEWSGAGNNTAGLAGGTVYDANGVDTDIYFSGDTSAVSSAFPTADGYIRAPAGGGGGGLSRPNDLQDPTGYGGNGGGGGAGRVQGFGGSGGTAEGFGAELGLSGEAGESGNVIGSGGFGGFGESETGGNGGDWGQAGFASLGGSLGGPAGKGIVDNGATVQLFGSSAARYINGNGDH